MDKRDRKRLVIAGCLNEILEHKPITKVTVVELCDEVGISRSTFYSYFTDVYEIGEWLWGQRLGIIFEGLGSEYGWYECNVRLYTELKEMQGRYDMVRPLRKEASKGTYAGRNTYTILAERIEVCRQAPLSNAERVQLSYVSRANEAMTLKWFEDSMDLPPEELSRIVAAIAPDFMIEAVGR